MSERRDAMAAAGFGAWCAIDDPLEACADELRTALQLVNALRIEMAIRAHSGEPPMCVMTDHLQPVSDHLVAAHEQIALRVPRYPR